MLTRSTILERVWDYDFGRDSNVLEVYVGYLRRKLEAEGEARVIHTVAGSATSSARTRRAGGDLRARLTLAYLVLLTLALSGFGIWVYAYVDLALHQEFYGSVQRQNAQLAQVLAKASLARAQRHRRGAGPRHPGALDQRPAARHLHRGRDPGGLGAAAGDRGQAPRGRPQRRRPAGNCRPGQVVNVRPAANDLGLPLAVYATRFEASKAVPDPTHRPDQPKDIVELEGRSRWPGRWPGWSCRCGCCGRS